MPALMEKRVGRLGADPDAIGGAGGNTIVLTAEAALLIGDIVFVSTAAAGSVNKSATVGDYVRFAGVAVGGGSTFGADLGIFDRNATGLALIPINKATVIQTNGIAWVTAGAAIALGARCTAGATAGRVYTGGVAGQTVGIAMDVAANAGDKIRMLITHI